MVSSVSAITPSGPARAQLLLRRCTMLRDRYEPMNVLALVSAPGMELDPVLTELDRLLDDDALREAIKADLATRYPRTLTDGRPSTPIEVILRMLVIKHLYGWSYAQTCQLVAGSLVLRQFCCVYLQSVPRDTTLLRWASLIRPATLHHLHDYIVELACERKVTRGRKLRIDGTVVETNIRYPVDSTLLGDGVRVLTRTILRAKAVLPESTNISSTAFRNRTRSLRRVMHQLIDTARRRGEGAADALQASYRRLVGLTTQVVRQAQQVEMALATATDARGQRLRIVLQTFIPRVRQVIDQTTRRVLLGQQLRASIEGRISGLKRRHKLDRCRYHGDEGMERWVGWGVITHNLRSIAQALVDRKKLLTAHTGFT